MKELRLFSNMLTKLRNEKNITLETLKEELGCSDDRFYAMLNGYTMPTLEQLNKLAALFEIEPEAIFKGDLAYYETTAVHCMSDFTNPESREEMLDIIEDYISLTSAINN
jgi:transcriptional regulator with XRE-family HTH domain